MVFLSDGRCSNPYMSGTWTQEGPKSVSVRYPAKPTWIQRFTLDASGQLECEHYEPAQSLQAKGTATRNAAVEK